MTDVCVTAAVAHVESSSCKLYVYVVRYCSKLMHICHRHTKPLLHLCCSAGQCSAVQHKNNVQLQCLLLRHNTVTDMRQSDIWQTCILTLPIKSLMSALAFATAVPLGQAFSASADYTQHAAISILSFPRLSLPSAERTQQLWSRMLTGRKLGHWHNKAKNQSHLDTSGFVCLTPQNLRMDVLILCFCLWH